MHDTPRQRGEPVDGPKIAVRTPGRTVATRSVVVPAFGVVNCTPVTTQSTGWLERTAKRKEEPWGGRIAGIRTLVLSPPGKMLGDSMGTQKAGSAVLIQPTSITASLPAFAVARMPVGICPAPAMTNATDPLVVAPMML